MTVEYYIIMLIDGIYHETSKYKFSKDILENLKQDINDILSKYYKSTALNITLYLYDTGRVDSLNVYIIDDESLLKLNGNSYRNLRLCIEQMIIPSYGAKIRNQEKYYRTIEKKRISKTSITQYNKNTYSIIGVLLLIPIIIYLISKLIYFK